MTEATEPKPKYDLLPTGKAHVSFSEIREYSECSWRHKLVHIDKVGKDLPGVHLDFGTSIHSACEEYLKTRKMNVQTFLKSLHELWGKHRELNPSEFTTASFKQFAEQGKSILADVPTFMDTEFPEWEFIDAEHFLYEPILNHPHAFKGYIDGVIKAKGARGKDVIWLLDWKTCGWGWDQRKKQDELVRSQLVLYKGFWSTKQSVDPKDVRCGFVLLKRTGKDGARCELVPTSVGEKTQKKSLVLIDNVIIGMKKGFAWKNRSSCTFCQFKDTEWCT